MPLSDSQIFSQQKSRITGRDLLLVAQAKSRIADVLGGALSPAELFAGYGKGAAAQLARLLATIDYVNACEPGSFDKATLPAMTANADGTVTVA